ncbi:MAG: hypothetical protein EYC71_13540 [Gammaproteobacteria bacterium]|nr:MAG: hypothetical protein EYC71_13540 [Gammaproteobacteria bacterium]
MVLHAASAFALLIAVSSISEISGPSTSSQQRETLDRPDDPAGNLAVRTDARNQRSRYVHDALNHIAKIQFGPAHASDPDALASVEETVRFAYDEASGGEGVKGRLLTITVNGVVIVRENARPSVIR